ncbi:ras GEF [Ramaria rubella]|nr:ras GEF [Ramaria rubella]
MLELQRFTMTSHSTETSSRRLRPTSIDSYQSTLSYDSYRSTISLTSASSTFVHAPSIYSSDAHTSLETASSPGSSLDVHQPETPLQDHHDEDSSSFYVLGRYDFESDDPDHVPFRKNDILKIINQQPSGWWAAQIEDRVGWIPGAFVETIPNDMVQRLLNVPHDLREYEYEAEALYIGDPMDDLSLRDDDDDEAQFLTTPSRLRSPRGFPTDVTPGPSSFDMQASLPPKNSPQPGFLTDSWHGPRNTRPLPNVPHTPRTPHTPIPPRVPAPAPSTMSTATAPLQVNLRQQQPSLKVNTTPLRVNKPTPPTPISTTPVSSQPSTHSSDISLPRSRSLGSSSSSISSSASSSSPPVTTPLTAGTNRKRPDPIMFSPASLKLPALIEDPSSPMESVVEVNRTASLGNGPYFRYNNPRRGNKVLRITGDDDAQAFHNAKTAQAQLPWYLRPEHSGVEIILEHDGSVKAGTLDALVERLTIEPLKLEYEKTFKSTFLMTFRTFTTADKLLDLLIARYETEPPVDLTQEEFDEWKEKRLKPTQARVLHVFTLWVQDHRLVEDGADIVPRLREFLELVQSPHAQNAKHILKLMESRRNSDINLAHLVASAPPRKSMRRHKNDLLRIDYTDLARQLTLYEARLYVKVQTDECLMWGSNQKDPSIQSLRSFVSTSDKLAAWVKLSILSNDALGKRADTIDMWIRVAEKCRLLNNYSSMSAIVAALTSQVIAKLQLTWAHVGRASHVEPLVKLSEPTGNFIAYRNLFSFATGPCLPYIGIYLSDMVKLSENAPNCIKAPPSGGTDEVTPELLLINFTKRQKMAEVAFAIVRHQPKVRDQYKIAEMPAIMQFLEERLRVAAEKDEGSFWMRSREVQHAELAHADIRKGLEAAGF